MTEVRYTDPATGGAKGRKPERLSEIPPECLEALARLYAYGREKYPDVNGRPNYEAGYPWSWSYDALMRHLLKFWSGEDWDESGHLHLTHAAWHCFALLFFTLNGRGTDDRRHTTEAQVSVEPPQGDEVNRTENGYVYRFDTSPPSYVRDDT